MAEKAFYTTLRDRGIVRVSGPGSGIFLQGLISNDIGLLETRPVLYACLLNPQGKFLHDFFITREDAAYSLECEGGDRSRDLAARLEKYRLRAQVKIECMENRPVYVGIGAQFNADPRHPGLGFRSFEKPGLPEELFETWDRLRISLTIPDGSRDLIPEKSTLDEGNIDKLNGVSYNKGCYVGQELTARMHHRGLGKKHLYTVSGELLRNPGEEIIINGKLLGEMRSRCGGTGIALLKDQFAA